MPFNPEFQAFPSLYVNDPSLKHLVMQCCPQLTRVFLREPCTTVQVGRCAIVNEIGI